METRDPPYPDYRTQGDVLACRNYRVVFWQHQLPPVDSGIAPEQMGWAELTVDLVDVEDVQEAIEWAENRIDEYLNIDGGEPHGERVYVLYVKVPREDRYLHISGWDPVRSPDAPADWNLCRRRPS
ncbi:MAG TPA: hypothetical protein VFG75_05165 [Gaiella sp.]|nr:hypothetical protein [Gaiella sp.]